MGLDTAESEADEQRDERPRFDGVSDHELIEATRGGQQDAFEEIVSRYKGPLVNFVFRMLGDYDEAIELTQEAFARVFFAIDRYHSKYAFSTYIYRIATNLAISEIRRRKRRRLYSLTGLFSYQEDSDEIYQPPDDRPKPDEEVVGREMREAIGKAINSLPERYKAPIILREIEERTYEEIADILDLGLGTTKSRISRGRGILRQRLERYLGEGEDEL